MSFVREEPRTYAVGIILAVLVGFLEFIGVSALIPALATSLGEAVTGIPAIAQRYLPTLSPFTVGIGLVVLILAQAAINFFRESYFLTRMARWRTGYSLDYVHSIASSSWEGLGKLKPGEVEVMLTRNIAVSMKLRHMTANLFAEGILAVMYIGIVLLISWYTSFLFLALGAIFALLHRMTVTRRMRYAVLAKERYVDVARRVIEYFADARSIAIGRQESLLNKLRGYLDEAAYAQLRNDQLNVFFINIHQPLIICSFVVAAAIFYALGEPLPTLVGIFYLFYRAAPHLVNVARNYGIILGESPIDVVPEITAWRRFAPDASRTVPPQDASIRLEGVDVRYDEAEPLLRNIDFTVAPGEFVCVQGRSGAGKSTILDVVCGFIHPRGGIVRLGGVDSRELDWSAWRAQLGLLRPEGVVVSGTWVENAAFLEDQPDLERVRRVLADVGLLEHVETVAGGIEAAIASRGADLSAGQRQRLLLARALYRDPKLLILDEPTSNLDQKTEEDVHELLLQLRGSRTVVVVTHRDRVLARADRIYEVTPEGTVRALAYVET